MPDDLPPQPGTPGPVDRAADPPTARLPPVPTPAGDVDGPKTGMMRGPPPTLPPPEPPPVHIVLDGPPSGVYVSPGDQPLGVGEYVLGGFEGPPPPSRIAPKPADTASLNDPDSIWHGLFDKPGSGSSHILSGAIETPPPLPRSAAPDIAPEVTPGSSHVLSDSASKPAAPDNPLADGSKVIGGEVPHVAPPADTSPDGARWGDSDVIEIGRPKPPTPGPDPLATQAAPGEAAKPPAPATEKLPAADPGATSMIEPGAKPPGAKPATEVLPNPLKAPGDAFIFHGGAPGPVATPAPADVAASHGAPQHGGGSTGAKVLKTAGMLPDLLQLADGLYRDGVELVTGEKEEGFVNPALEGSLVGAFFDRVAKASPLTTSLVQGVEEHAGHTAGALAGIATAPVQLVEVVWTGGTRIGSEIANRTGLTDVLADGLMSLLGIEDPPMAATPTLAGQGAALTVLQPVVASFQADQLL